MKSKIFVKLKGWMPKTRVNKTTWFLVICFILFLLILLPTLQNSELNSDRNMAYDEQRDSVTKNSQELSFDLRPPEGASIGKPVGSARQYIAQDLEYFKQWAKYPPKSRPLFKEQTDLIEYYWVRMPFQPMPSRSFEGFFNDTHYYCRIQPLEHSVTENEDMLVTLQCSKNENGIKLVPLKIEKTEIRRIVNSVISELEQSNFDDFNDEGLGGDFAVEDNIYTFRYQPGKKDAGQIYVFVKFNIPDESFFFDHQMMASFLSTPIAPAYFTGEFEESIEDGSLIIHAGIHVLKTGRYQIYGNLMADDEPIGYTNSIARLDKGKQTVNLLYFGKIFHDKGIEGRYSLVGLRGHRENLPIDPDMLDKPASEDDNNIEKKPNEPPENLPFEEIIPDYSGAYTTKKYKLSDFSSAEWDSEFKKERIQWTTDQMNNAEDSLSNELGTN